MLRTAAYVMLRYATHVMSRFATPVQARSDAVTMLKKFESACLGVYIVRKGTATFQAQLTHKEAGYDTV